MEKWEKIVNQLPESLKELFYSKWNGEFQICPRCKNKFPNHKLFFHNCTSSICKECVNSKFIHSKMSTTFKDDIPEGYKFCNKCKQILPATTNYFTRRKNGFSSHCKKCRGFENYGISLLKVNQELGKIGLKKCHLCGEIKSIKEFNTVGKTRRNEYCNDCIEEHKKLKREYDKEYYIENKEYKNNYYEDWKLNGGYEKRKESEQKRQDSINSLPNDFTKRDWLDILNYFDCSCAYCGITQEELDRTKLQRDHIIPVSKNGAFTKSNIVCCCPKCNSKKKDMDLDEFYEHSDDFILERYEKVLNHIYSNLKENAEYEISEVIQV